MGKKYELREARATKMVFLISGGGTSLTDYV